MKKLLLAITMMVGLVAGFSLTSCGGGGGDENPISFFAAKTFKFANISTGSMVMTVGAPIGNDGTSASAVLSFPGTGQQTTALITLENVAKDANGELIGCRMLLSGMDADCVSDPGVLAFFNMSSRDNNDSQITQTLSFALDLLEVKDGMNLMKYRATVTGVNWDQDGGEGDEWGAEGYMHRTL